MERGLDLSRQAIASLSQIPRDVIRHVEQEEEPYALSLAQNRLTELHDIHVFHNVLQLDLSGNRLQSLEGIEALQLLESLNVARNSLTTIDSLTALPRLRVLNAAENNLTQVDALRQMKGIVAVDLSYNSISKWPQLSQITTLESIDLSSNALEAFPVATAIRMFPRSLKRLLLGKNRIQEVSGIASLGMFLQKLETIKLDGNPAVQRIIREGGCLDFLWVNLFASVSFSKGQGMRRDDFVVPPDTVVAVEDAVQQGDEVLLSQFLVTGALSFRNQPKSVFQTPAYHSTPSRRTESDANDRYNMEDTRFQQPKIVDPGHQLPPPAPTTVAPSSSENGENGLSKESKMELWKRMMSERKGPEKREVASTVSPVAGSESTLSKVPSVAPVVIATPPAKLQSPVQAPPPAPGLRLDQKSVSMKASPSTSLPPPHAASVEPLVAQMKTMNEQVMGIRKYVKVWVKREQLVREAAAKRIQRFLRRRRWKLHLSLRIRQSQVRRRGEYGVEHFASASVVRPQLLPPQLLPPQQIYLYAHAVVIQRHIRGWLMRFRVSRWMYYSQAAEKLQSAWRQRRGQRFRVKNELGLLQNPACRANLGTQQRDYRTERLENAVAMLATDIRQLQRVFVVQEQVIARQSREIAQYKRFVTFAVEPPLVKLQSLWRGYYTRRQLNLRSTRHRIHHTTAAKPNDVVAALRSEVESLKALVQSLLAQKSTD